MSAMGSGPESWGDRERELRAEEVAAQRSLAKAQWCTGAIQGFIALAALGAALAAVFTAAEAKNAVHVAAKGLQQQDVEAQLATAVTALGGKNSAERVAGVTLLVRNVTEQVDTAGNADSRQNAYHLYQGAVSVLSTYLRGRPLAQDAPCPVATTDVTYAADQLKLLLDEKSQVTDLNAGSVAIDLSDTELCSQYWGGIRLDWLSGTYLANIDLRGANLTGSQWGKATLTDAHLQCANLAGADLSRANLQGADLRGADLVGTTLPSTLTAAQLAGAIKIPTANWSNVQCLQNAVYRIPLSTSHIGTDVRSN